MSQSEPTLRDLQEAAIAFRDERDWRQFHSPRNLSIAMSIEAAELQEVMLWKSDGEVDALLGDAGGHGRLSDELADVVIYALLLADAAQIDLAKAIPIKLKKNAAKYPVDQARGNATKYTDL